MLRDAKGVIGRFDCTLHARTEIGTVAWQDASAQLKPQGKRKLPVDWSALAYELDLEGTLEGLNATATLEPDPESPDPVGGTIELRWTNARRLLARPEVAEKFWGQRQ